MKLLYFTVLIFLYPFSFIWSKPSSQESVLQVDRFFVKPNIPIDSIADSDDTTALFLNPAGLSIHPVQAGYFYRNNLTNNIQDHTILLNLFGLAFGSQWRLGPNNEWIRRYTIGSGLGNTKLVSFGFSFTWIESTSLILNNYISLNLGVLFRPTRWLSLGIVGHNLTTHRTPIVDFRHRWQFGLSFRPLCFLPTVARKYYDSLTLSAEITWVIGESYKTILPRYIVNMSPVAGLSIYVGADHRHDLFTGVKFSQNIVQFSVQGDILPGAVDHLNKQEASRGNYYNIGFLIGQERFTNKIEAIRYYLEISLDTYFEEKGRSTFLFFNTKYSFFDILNAIQRAATDPQIKGIILTGRKFSGGWGQAEELREILTYFRQISGKSVIAYLEEAGNKEYYIASMADSISMPEGGSLTFNGLSANLYYIKDLLDKLGIKGNFVQIGKYKTAPDLFQRSSPTSYEEEQVTKLLEDLNFVIKEDILTSRPKFTKERYNELMNKGLFSATKAQEVSLIDTVEYLEDIKKRLKLTHILNWKLPLHKYLSTTIYKDTWGPEPTIAVVIIDGDIVSGAAKDQGIFSTHASSSDVLSKTFEKIRYNKNILGVIVRINSPGGSALASDILWKEVSLLKDYNKKVIVSFGNVAASGGYYIAVGGGEIITNRSTVTGSIGIFGGKFSLNGLYNLLGINKTTIKTAENAAIFSEKDDFTPKERILMEEHLKSFYSLFLKRVSDGRSRLSKEIVENNAEGLVFSGAQAVKNGMADHIGGLMLAKELLIERLNLDPNYTRFEVYPKEQDSLVDLSLNKNLIIPYSIKKIASLWMRTEKAQREQVYFLMPYDLDIQ